MREKHKTRVETHAAKLDREHDRLKSQLKSVNRELGEEKINTAVWVVIILLMLSVAVTGIEMLRYLHPGNIEEFKVVTHERNITTSEGQNWDYVLKDLRTESRSYASGEAAKVIFTTESKRESKAMIEYILTDQSGEQLYRYRTTQTLEGKQTMTKDILLTENYDPGRYEMQVKIFVEDGKEYLMNDTTEFNIDKRKILASLDSPARITNRQLILLVIILLLNITLVYLRTANPSRHD